MHILARLYSNRRNKTSRACCNFSVVRIFENTKKGVIQKIKPRNMLVHLSLCGGCTLQKSYSQKEECVVDSNARNTLEIKVRNNAPALKNMRRDKGKKKKGRRYILTFRARFSMLCKREALATRHQQRTRGYNGFSIFIFLRRFVATTLYKTYFGDS